jgi:hypothetical protein
VIESVAGAKTSVAGLRRSYWAEQKVTANAKTITLLSTAINLFSRRTPKMLC